MRVFWVPTIAVLADLAVPARAEPSLVPLEALVGMTDSAVAKDATAPVRGEALPPGRATLIPDAGLPRLAFGLNAPWGWYHGSIGVSAYLGLGDHHAVRANVARYHNSAPLLGEAMDEDDVYSGNIFDVGVSWVWYPKQLWDGFTLEAGAIRRGRDISVELFDETIVSTKSATYAGRVLVGWSWLATRHTFVAVAAGFSEGVDDGHETRTTMVSPHSTKTTTAAVHHLEAHAEAYLRFGVALGH